MKYYVETNLPFTKENIVFVKETVLRVLKLHEHKDECYKGVSDNEDNIGFNVVCNKETIHSIAYQFETRKMLEQWSYVNDDNQRMYHRFLNEQEMTTMKADTLPQ